MSAKKSDRFDFAATVAVAFGLLLAGGCVACLPDTERWVFAGLLVSVGGGLLMGLLANAGYLDALRRPQIGQDE